MTNQKRDQLIYQTLGVTDLLDDKQSQVRPADEVSSDLSSQPASVTTDDTDLFVGVLLTARKKELLRDMLIGQSYALIPYH